MQEVTEWITLELTHEFKEDLPDIVRNTKWVKIYSLVREL